ncbi:uncharacterized protein LOC110995877 isoform X2 [Pieris rapae]|uniref:uncharacterized protein LOC110995877 isoform X2 n=1 Tax=Pieris rapae TaxID=64459 RepID=UPI001E27BCB7|nr:uncharacterized protein LOC110995877 isoform X2 [Pieris rapae]
MENIYDDLENYEEANIIEDLKNENSELKTKLEQYSSTINQLQIDFENLSSEYKKLELNYSSLLKTARAEIERKTNMISQLNLEKDMMIIQTFQNNGRRCFTKVTCNNKATSKNTEIDSRYRTEDIHCKSVGKRKSGLCTKDIKENVWDSKQKTFSKNTPNFKESIPSQFKNRCDEEQVHLSKEQRLRDDEALGKKSSKIKNSHTIEGKQLYHQSVSTRSDNDRYSDYLYRQRERARHRRDSPQRISRHRSRSPPADRISRHKSQDRRRQYESEHSAHHDKILADQTEQPILKHKLLPHSEEPSQKKIRVDSYGTYAISERSCGDSELISFGEALMAPDDPLGSCQSPDYLHCDADHASVKEIIHTATTPQADPRITSKKYIVQTENGKEVLKSHSSSEFFLQRVNPSLWGVPKVIVPDALLQKPSVQCLQGNLQTLPESNKIGLSISLNPPRDDRNSSIVKVNSNGFLTKTISIASESPEVNIIKASKPPQYSTNNTDFPSLLTNACKAMQESANTSKNKLPFINDTELSQLVSIETIEGDLLLSDEGSDNADRTSAADKTTIIKIKNTKTDNNTFTYQSSSNCGENKMISDMITNKNVEFDSKIPEDQENNFLNLPDTEVPSKDPVKSLQNENNRSKIDIISKNSDISLESSRAEKSLSNKQQSKLGKNATCNGELDQVSDINECFNVTVKNNKIPLVLPGNLKSETGSEDSTDTSTKIEKSKKYQEAKQKERSDKQSKGHFSNKKHKKKKLDETKLKESDKITLKNTKIVIDTVAPDSHRKFCDLFGESSNSLIMPEDLGIRSEEATESLKIKFASNCTDTQNAVDRVEIDPNPGPSLIKKSTVDTRVDVCMTAGEQLTNGIGSPQLTTLRSENVNLFENIKPAISTDSPDVVTISTGVQSKLLEGDIVEDIPKNISIETARPLTALATSTPLKDQKCVPASQPVKDTVRDVVGDVPDVRIFVKRRRKIKKL